MQPTPLTTRNLKAFAETPNNQMTLHVVEVHDVFIPLGFAGGGMWVVTGVALKIETKALLYPTGN